MMRLFNKRCLTRFLFVAFFMVLIPGFVHGLGEPLYDAQGHWKGTKIYDESGQWHGLFNSNPDPDGDPWIAGGLPDLTPEDQDYYKSLPLFTMGEAPRADLPLTVRHTTSPYFRPVFIQWGGSCGQASSIGYHYTFERNQALNIPCNSNADNMSSYIFTWNFVNDGINQGSWPAWGYQIAQYMGVARESDFDWANGTFYTNWLSGYTEYMNALQCHVKADSIVTFETTDIESMKAWLYDKGTGTGTNGGAITMAAAWPWDTSGVISDGPFAGYNVVTTCPAGSDHALTIAGYSDEITVGESTGAFLVVNSHGTSWGTGGMVWVMYDAFDTNANYYFMSMEVEPNNPLLVIKATVTSEKRNTVDIVMGCSPQLYASEPAKTVRVPWVFNKTGGEYPMLGDGKSTTMQIALDASCLIPEFTEGRGTVFLQAEGDAVVDALSVVYYGGDTPQEFFYDGPPAGIFLPVDLGVNIDFSGRVVERDRVVKNYPNPFADSTNIEYELKEEGRVILSVYNARGQKIRTLVEGNQGYGVYIVAWDGCDDQAEKVSSGVYYVMLEINGTRNINKMALIK